MKKQALTRIASIAGFALGAFALSTLAAGTWTAAPASGPTGNNVDAPINVGGGTAGNTYSQSKTGLLALASMVFNPTGTANIKPGSIMVAKDANGTVGWQNPSATLSRDYTRVACNSGTAFYWGGGNSGGATNDLKYTCVNGQLTGIADGQAANIAPTTADSFTRCGNPSWQFEDSNNGNDMFFVCQTGTNYLLSICNNSYDACPFSPTDTTKQYPIGQGIYCDWAGNDTYGGGGTVDCEQKHVVAWSEWNSATPAPFYTISF